MSHSIDLNLVPAASPPPGVQSNFIDPPTFDNAAITTVVLCVLTTTLAVLARIFTKIRLIKNVAAEDCMFLILFRLYTANVSRYVTVVMGNIHGVQRYCSEERLRWI